MAKKSKRTIRALFADAAEDLASQKSYKDPPSEQARGEFLAGQWPGYPYGQMPPECPIAVHGHKMGVVYVTDAAGQLIELDKGDAVSTCRLFGKFQNFPEWAFPRWGKSIKDPESGKMLPPRINGLEFQKLYRCLVAEGDRQGLFDPSKQHRGRGGWVDTDGNFLWHSGEYLYSIKKGKLVNARPGGHMGYLYTVQPANIAPWQEAVPRAESPARELLKDFGTWNWERPYLDPILLVGWMVTALMGGALPWRPIIFTTGGAGVGKSTLHGIIEAVLDSAVMATSDTTAAGIYQNIKQDSTGVIVDEFEAAANMAKRQPVIDLARIAASGASMFRGGADHTGTTFEVRCSFMFSAINQPAMGSADKSRMVVLNLGRLEVEGFEGSDFVYSPDQGRMLLRQVMDGWKDFSERLLPDYQRILRKVGFNERQVDTYGTLLAAAELALGPEALEEAGLPVTDERALGALIEVATKAERIAQKENWHKCLEILLDCPIDAYKGGERPTVGGVLAELTEIPSPLVTDIANTRGRLALAGLALKEPGKIEGAEGFALCVPGSGVQLDKVFTGSNYHGEVWNTALKQGPNDFILRNVKDRAGLTNNSFKVKIGISTKHCLLIDLVKFQQWQEEDA
ncbi:MAG: hypothetical protein JKY94_10385 [Rhodobacteraceae bacterium]|nr:hypothetical protein [Paracoccaceae bacterium]